jgi:hypothetical protein
MPFTREMHVTIGRCVDDSGLNATTADPADLAGRAEYLSLR